MLNLWRSRKVKNAVACLLVLYHTLPLLQHSNSQLLQLLHLHHCLQRAKSQLLAREIIWTQPDARDKQTENWFVTSQSCLTDCELVNIWWTEDDNHMYLTEERATSSYKNCIVPSLGKAIVYFHNWHVQIYVFGYVHRQSSIPILAHNSIHKMWVSLQL